MQPIIVFRPYMTDDAPQLAKAINNYNIWKNLRDALPHPYTEKDAEEFITMSREHDPVCNMAVVMDGTVIGGIGYVPGHDVHRLSAEIGYWLAEPFWGRGIMSSVIREFSDWIFKNTDIIHLHAGIYGYNRPSMRVLEKAGFDKVGVMHNACIKEGNIIDLHFYEKQKG